MTQTYDAIVIGGGFFGLSVADHLRRGLGQKRVLLLEKEADFMQRASYHNQARVHGGYHYPRSLLTGLRSQVNFEPFTKDYEQAIVTEFDKYYAIGRNFSKVTARQFKLFCDRIGASITPAPAAVHKLFNQYLVEDVFRVREYAFNTETLKKQLVDRLSNSDVTLLTKMNVRKVGRQASGVAVETDNGQSFQAKQVFNCSYSLINDVNINSNLPIITLKHELAEMCLVELPPELENISVTIMCGPFFSFMPFPAQNLHTLSHVRYTPHQEWHDEQADGYRHNHKWLKELKLNSNFSPMIHDAERYVPSLRKAIHKSSLWEIKTVLPTSEVDDSRPILFRRDHGIEGYSCIMGGKLDNIYDVLKELDIVYGGI